MAGWLTGQWNKTLVRQSYLCQLSSKLYVINEIRTLNKMALMRTTTDKQQPNCFLLKQQNVGDFSVYKSNDGTVWFSKWNIFSSLIQHHRFFSTIVNTWLCPFDLLLIALVISCLSQISPLCIYAVVWSFSSASTILSVSVYSFIPTKSVPKKTRILLPWWLLQLLLVSWFLHHLLIRFLSVKEYLMYWNWSHLFDFCIVITSHLNAFLTSW